jgi:NAD(P)-dependent dehydrogenase (short-subunit alcohol dehydrogenase family)
MRLEGQHAVVTGGGTGIGATVAEVLEAEGATVSRIGRRPEKLGPNGYVADVSDRDQIEAAFAAARAAHGPISILIPNAGAAESAPFAKTSMATWRRMLAVNLDGVFHACQAAIGDLAAVPRGRIVTIASTSGLRGFPYSAAYGTAKHAAVGLTRMIAADYAGTSLTANAVCPGFTDTDLVEEAAVRVSGVTGLTTDALKIRFGGFNPSGRLIMPAEVAAIVLDLILSDRSGEAVVIE